MVNWDAMKRDQQARAGDIEQHKDNPDGVEIDIPIIGRLTKPVQWETIPRTSTVRVVYMTATDTETGETLAREIQRIEFLDGPQKGEIITGPFEIEEADE